MPGQPTLPYGHIALPADLLATALYGLGQYEAAQIELRGDGLRPSTSTCSLVTWLWDNGRQREATNVVSTTCAVLRGGLSPAAPAGSRTVRSSTRSAPSWKTSALRRSTDGRRCLSTFTPRFPAASETLRPARRTALDAAMSGAVPLFIPGRRGWRVCALGRVPWGRPTPFSTAPTPR